MRLVDRMARALDDGHMAAGPLVVEAFKLRIDDLVTAGDDSPARLGPPRSGAERRREDIVSGRHLRTRLELCLLARPLGVRLPSVASSSPTSGACAAT